MAIKEEGKTEVGGESGSGSFVQSGWKALPTATKMILGAVFALVGLGLLGFLLG